VLGEQGQWAFSTAGQRWLPGLEDAPRDPLNESSPFWQGGLSYGYATWRDGCRDDVTRDQYFLLAARLEVEDPEPTSPALDCTGQPLPRTPHVYLISDLADPDTLQQAVEARDRQRIADLAAIRAAILAYRDAHGRLPELPTPGTWAFSTDGPAWIPGLGEIPTDPLNQG
jgi:hypothetical protein